MIYRIAPCIYSISSSMIIYLFELVIVKEVNNISSYYTLGEIVSGNFVCSQREIPIINLTSTEPN